MTLNRMAAALGFSLLAGGCGSGPETAPRYDVLITNGVVYDGTGAPGRPADVAIIGDRIEAVGALGGAQADLVIDADGRAVSPGFINMLSWATESLLVDPLAQSDIRQGVTLEVMGEGSSMGPLTPAMKEEMTRRQGDLTFDVAWTSLGDYLSHLEERGVAPNVASFVGATTVRVHELGYEDRPPTQEELSRMQDLVEAAMEEGALGVGASLIYAPAFYAQTDELTALAEAAARHGGGYIVHMRSEGDRFLEGIEETIEIARGAGSWARIYHFKPAGQANWDKRDAGVALMEAAREEGVDIAANMYLYTAGATGLDAAMPPWVQEGGHEAWVRRLKDPDIRARVTAEMAAPGDGWENLYAAAGGPENLLFTSFKNDALKPLTGKTLAEVAAMRGKSAEETMIDLVIEDDSRVGTVYFLMSEKNVRKNIAWEHMTFGSDAGAPAADGVFLKSNPHPRAYGNFARLLGRYVRDEQVIPLEEAIRRLTTLSAEQLRLENRSCLAPGCFADVVVFDPDTIEDKASFAEPHRYAAGVSDVLVNGVPVIEAGEPTGATPGRFVKGPGYRGQ